MVVRFRAAFQFGPRPGSAVDFLLVFPRAKRKSFINASSMDRRAENLIDACDNEQNIRMLTLTITEVDVYKLQGGSNELGSNRRQLEAVQGQHQARVGETHRRSARCN